MSACLLLFLLVSAGPSTGFHVNNTAAKQKGPGGNCHYDNYLKTTKCTRLDGSISLKKSGKGPLPNGRSTQSSNNSNSVINSVISGRIVNSKPSNDATALRSSTRDWSNTAAAACTIDLCAGVNLKSAILADLAPWRSRGGITRADVDQAMSWKVLMDTRTKMYRREWVRVTIFRGKLYVKNLGAGYGTRDAVFLLMILELLETRASEVPDVDFVQYTFDRAFLKKEKASSAQVSQKVPLPFALSFARHKDYLDVGIPDSSFWGWPEVSVNPHWHLSESAQARTPWEAKVPKLHWRGSPRRTGYLREALAACATELKQPATASAGMWADVKLRAPGGADWEHPLGLSKYKLALFIQGEGYTSSKQRTLASGSCPVFAELHGHDTYFGRFLTQDVHYKRIGVTPIPEGKRCTEAKNGGASKGGGCAHCGDMAAIIRWAAANDAAAKACADSASTLAHGIFSRRMLLEYVLVVLQETAKLQGGEYDVGVVVAQVHGEEGGGGEGGGGGGGKGATGNSPTPVTKTNLATIMQAGAPASALSASTTSKKAWASACSHDPENLRAAEVLCENAVRLAQWWLAADRASYEGKAVPPCNPSLCHKCCKAPTGLTR